MNAEDFQRAHETGVQILTAVLTMVKLYADEAGMDKAYNLLSRWTAAFVGPAVSQTKELLNITDTDPKAFYDVMKTVDETLGDRWEMIAETPERITHRIHDCIFREACVKVGLDPSEVCTKAVHPITHELCSVINPELEWICRTTCSSDSDTCVYEIRYQKTQEE